MRMQHASGTDAPSHDSRLSQLNHPSLGVRTSPLEPARRLILSSRAVLTYRGGHTQAHRDEIHSPPISTGSVPMLARTRSASARASWRPQSGAATRTFTPDSL